MKFNRSFFQQEIKAKRHNTEDTVLIKEDEQERELTEAYMECLSKQEEIIEADYFIYCPITFDSITCWPQAKMNQTIILPCANYVNKFNTKGMLTSISLTLYPGQSLVLGCFVQRKRQSAARWILILIS
jgi:hypothetical protein